MRNGYTTLSFLILLSFQTPLNAQRDDVSGMNVQDQEALRICMMDYLNSEVDLTKSQGTAARYLIVQKHVDNSTDWHNGHEDAFFTGHRDYIQDMEQWMLNEETGICKDYVPLPSWNPEADFGIPDEFYNGASVLPGFAPMLVQGTGAPNDPHFPAMQPFGSETCTTYPLIDNFAPVTQSDHTAIHNHAGGVMQSTPTSPAAAIFWLWHGFVDDMYNQYQRECQSCDAAFVRAIGDESEVDFTIDLSHSTFVENYTFTLIDRTDNTVPQFAVFPYIVNSDPNVRRIDFSDIPRCKLYTLVINGTNDSCSNSAFGGSDEVELNFFAHGAKTYLTNSKFIDECDWTTVVLQNVCCQEQIVKLGPNDDSGFYDLYLLNNSNGNLTSLKSNEPFSGSFIPDFNVNISNLQSGSYSIIAEKDNELVYEQFVVSQ